MFAHSASFPNISDGLEIVDHQQVNLGDIDDIPNTIFGRQQSLDDVSLSDLWPRPILSRSYITPGSCDTGRRPHYGTATIPGCTTTSVEPNQGPLATAPQDLSTTFHYLRQHMQLGPASLKVQDNNYQDQYASQRVPFDAEASLRDLIASWETVTGSHFAPTSTTSYKADMTPITQSQIVHAGKSYSYVTNGSAARLAPPHYHRLL